MGRSCQDNRHFAGSAESLERVGIDGTDGSGQSFQGDEANKSTPQQTYRQKSWSSENAVVPRWKRTLDVTLVFVSLPVVIPLMGLVAVLIKIVSKGPVILRQERIGFLGRRFTCLKFRTMHCGADTSVHENYVRHLTRSDAPMLKREDLGGGDPRLIRFGGLLRATGLDELPQLINVLRGEMSLVGPRPCMPYEYEQYEPWHMERFLTLPGLTGLWQVSGKNHTTFKQMMQLDIEYVRRKTLWFDLMIILKTIPTLVAQVGEKLERMTRKLVRTYSAEVHVTSNFESISVEGVGAGGHPANSDMNHENVKGD